MKKINRRSFLAAAGLTAAALALTACGGSAPAPLLPLQAVQLFPPALPLS